VLELCRDAGVPVETKLGRAWAYTYRGEMTVEAIASEWLTVSP
jgi:hypothetical protein